MADAAAVLFLGLFLAMGAIVLAVAGLTYVLHRAVTRTAGPLQGHVDAAADDRVSLTDRGRELLAAYSPAGPLEALGALEAHGDSIEVAGAMGAPELVRSPQGNAGPVGEGRMAFARVRGSCAFCTRVRTFFKGL